MAESCNENKRKNQGLRDPGNLLVLIYIVVITICWLIGGVVDAYATEAEEKGVRIEDARQGELLVLGEDRRLEPAPMLSQKVKVSVSGITARVVVEQRFANSGSSWVEAVYVFPLPDESSVDHLRLRIGERVLDGMIMEKSAAKKTHEKARSEGRKSSLLTQNRPNMFTTRVANIGPGEEVTVEIEYQQTISFVDNVFSLRFPMVVGPRYIPGVPLGNTEPPVTVRSSGWALNTDQVPDASEITPPVDRGSKIENKVELSVDLAAGIPLSRIESLYHGTEIVEVDENHYKIELTSEVKADRDFVLEWQPKNSAQVKAALFAEQKGKDQYMLLMLIPPDKPNKLHVPREVVFVLDISGSMAGASIKQAKAAVSAALKSLSPSDRFNIVVFNNKASMLYEHSRSADKPRLRDAAMYIENINAEGGTEMKPALLLALDGSNNHERLRQVVFLTDGAVGNEGALLDLISKRLGASRLFTVGIGSAPNSYFMSRAASIGRGTFTYIGKEAEVKMKMMSLFAKLEHPVLSDLRLNLGGSDSDVEIYPSPMPDLYVGEPLILSMRTGWENQRLRLSGMNNGQPWQASVDLSPYGQREGIGALWARKKIRSQMEFLALGAGRDEVRNDVVQTAIEHHLVSKYTSLVAVDSRISRPQGEKEREIAVKTHLPHGWEASAVFGGGAQTSTPARMRLLIGVFLILSAVLILLLGKKRCRDCCR